MTNSQTLAERISAGRISAAEAYRVAVSLAELLGEMHQTGHCHGALTPSAVVITASGLELLPPADAGVTPYTAPELVRGRPADERSDIFSFGAILYEMFTGRRAFEAEDAQMLCAILLNVEPQPCRSAVVDRLVAGCVAKSADGRFRNIERLQLELRLLASAVRRGAPFDLPEPAPKAMAAVAGAGPRPASPAGGAVRSEMQALESRMASRMEEQEKSIASVERIASEVLKALREGPAPAQGRAQERRYAVGDYDDPTVARLDRAFALLSEKVSRIDLAVSTTLERLEKLEASLDNWDVDAAALRETVTRDIRGFERTLKGQSAALESARTAMAQTDDLVERVVEALDSLQSMFVSSAEERKAS